jgi:hypothetical protein
MLHQLTSRFSMCSLILTFLALIILSALRCQATIELG